VQKTSAPSEGKARASFAIYRKAVQISYEARLRDLNIDDSKQNFVAIWISIFDFELFISVHFHLRIIVLT